MAKFGAPLRTPCPASYGRVPSCTSLLHVGCAAAGINCRDRRRRHHRARGRRTVSAAADGEEGRGEEAVTEKRPWRCRRLLRGHLAAVTGRDPGRPHRRAGPAPAPQAWVAAAA
ncbi:hypothetical protein BS78_10G109000 [Paspalum vaginatum]|nr:hypothetical protein BS78_10G109000 [Paspalum vaginatum]